VANFPAKMRRHNDQKLRDVLLAVFQDYALEDKLLEVQLRQRWPEIMGPAVARYTDEIKLSKGVLRLRFSSAPMRDQFRYSTAALRDQVNEALGGNPVRDVQIS
jgi:predicted nucleic acid-binding Zn ribbon protein